MVISNKEHWKKVPANETTTTKIDPSDKELSNIPLGADILDVGCGDGQLTEWLSERWFRVKAIDLNPNAIEANQMRNTQVVYSTQDIVEKTTFSDSFFDLLCFRFTLANIHRHEWWQLTQEVERLVKPAGFIWFAEPLVSDDYQDRYNLSYKLLNDEHAMFVFKDPEAAARITTAEQLQIAIDQGLLSRISRHFTQEELMGLFPSFKIVQERTVQVVSPSGFRLDTWVVLLQKICD